MSGPAYAIAVTVFKPDMDLLLPLLRQAVAETPCVLVHLDGPPGVAIGPDALERLKAIQGVELLHSRENRGIAAGLNSLARAAASRGFVRLLYFDQDSEPAARLGERLCLSLERLREMGHKPAAIGPSVRPAEGTAARGPHYPRRGAPNGHLQPVDFVIVSGCLIDLAAWERVGPFREDFRMDAVDVEWCLRAWHDGHSVWLDRNEALVHRIGSGSVRLGPWEFPRQSEARMANYAYSQGLMLRLKHIPLRWKLRAILYVPVQFGMVASQSPAFARTFVRLSNAMLCGFRRRQDEMDATDRTG